MVEQFVKSSGFFSLPKKIPFYLIIVIIVSYLLPISKEIFLTINLEWLWFLYLIPALILSYYHGLRGALANIFLAGGAIILLQSYHILFFGKHSDVYLVITVSLGTIFSMAVASFAVAILSTKLHIARESSKIILETTATAVGIIDISGKVIYVNEALEKLTNTSRDKILGKYIWETHFKKRKFDEDGSYASVLLETLNTGKCFSNLEHTFKNKHGKELTLLIDTFVLRNEMQEIVGAMSNLRDITDKRSMERQVQQAEKFKVLGQTAAGLAHEIKNPLTSVRGFLQIFKAKEKNFDKLKYINIMLSEIDRINNLLTDFLILAKPTSSKYEKCSLEKILENIISFLHGELNLYQIKLKINYKGNLPQLYIDQDQIKQVLLHIIKNSIEAMPQGGPLEINCFKALNSDELVVEIKDQGIGISQKCIDNIYNPFYTTKDEGTGMGLAIAYRIIKNHDGWINVESKEGKGTKVSFGLPIITLNAKVIS